MFGLADRITHRRFLSQTSPKGAISAFQVHQGTQNYSAKYTMVRDRFQVPLSSSTDDCGVP